MKSSLKRIFLTKGKVARAKAIAYFFKSFPNRFAAAKKFFYTNNGDSNQLEPLRNQTQSLLLPYIFSCNIHFPEKYNIQK